MAARFLLLRVLPRRLLPIITIAEAVMLLRSVRNRAKVRVNPPTASRTAPPASRTAPPAPVAATPGGPVSPSA